MVIKLYYAGLLLSLSLLLSCNSRNQSSPQGNTWEIPEEPESFVEEEAHHDEDNESWSSYDEESNFAGDERIGYQNGSHLAQVDYYNPETGYSATYTLYVEIEDNYIVQINFPNDGWLDDDHITPEMLDEAGTCTIYGEEGKSYEIRLL